MLRTLLAAASITFLAGCSSTPVDPSTAKNVPANRALAHQAEVQGGGLLVITRDNGYWASGGCFATIVIDGKKAARIDTGEVARFHLQSGRHIVGVAGDADGSGLCAMQVGQPLKEMATDLRVGEVQRFRVTGTQNGNDIRPSSM